MRFLIDECLHTSLVDIAVQHSHEAHHVTRLGLSGKADHALIKIAIDGDFTLVTHNAVDFRRLFARQKLHAGLVIIVPQVVPSRQRTMFGSFLATLGAPEMLLNEVVEIETDGHTIILDRYDLPS